MPDIPMIISVDDHVVEPPHLWKSWLPARFTDAGPKVVRLPYEMDPTGRSFLPAASGPETDFWIYEDLQMAIHLGLASAGFAPEDIELLPIRYDEMRPGCYQVKERLEDMTLNHVERSLCFPTFPRFCGQTFLEAKDKELALACVLAYNDWMVEEWCGDSEGRLIPLCLIPLWDPQRAAAEVRRNAVRGVRAVAFSELPAHLGLPSIHDANGAWNPFFEACDETGTVICIHIGSSSQLATSSADAPISVVAGVHMVNSVLTLADWLLSGLLARYPGIKLAMSESQVGWMPYIMERADNIWRQGRAHLDMPPEITQPPSAYMRHRVYGCIFDDEFGLKSRYEVGVDQITFEVDYPHGDTTWPDTLARVEKTMAGIPEIEREKILRLNAIKMLDLPPTIAPASTG